jgi:hypothetical protein
LKRKPVTPEPEPQPATSAEEIAETAQIFRADAQNDKQRNMLVLRAIQPLQRR